MQYKLTLDTDKVVVLNEFTIKLKNNAIEAVSARTSAKDRAFDSLLQDEVLRQLIVSIDGRTIGGAEREDLDKLITINEYGQLMQALGEVMGGAAAKKPKIEIITGNS